MTDAGTSYRRLSRIFSESRGKLLYQVLVAVLLVAMEGAGLGWVLVLLGGGAIGGNILPRIPGLGNFSGAIASLSVPGRIRVTALALVSIMMLRSGLQYIQNLQGACLQRAVERKLQLQILGKLHELPVSYLQKERAGNLLTVVGLHSRRIGQLVLSLSQAIVHIVVLVAYTGLAMWLSWPLTLLTVALLVPVVMVLRPMLSVRLRAAGRRTRDLNKALFGIFQENLAATSIIRLFDRCEWSLERSRKALNDLHASETRVDKLAGLSRPVFTFINATALALLLTVASFLMVGSTTVIVPQLALFLVITFRLQGPLSGLVGFQTQFTHARPVLEEIDEFLACAERLVMPDGAIPFSNLRKGVTLERVSFRYAPSEPDVLRNVDVDIRTDCVTAVVGSSGAGKSSLVHLITRLYDVTGGAVFVDGLDLRQLQIRTWRKRVAVVSQEVFLFHASVRENLRFARPEATDADIVDACQLVQAHEFILAMPEGYDTILQERGMRLSGGQRQRIALARALLINADLLILDEATSELDTHTEKAVHDALVPYFAGRAVLIIAHRLSAVCHADRIYVLERGRIVEQGNHNELMRGGGVYRRLAEAQKLPELQTLSGSHPS